MDTSTQTLRRKKRKIKSTQLFVVAGTILVSLLISLVCVGLTIRYEVDTETADVKSIEYWKLDLPPEQDVWYEMGIEELKSIVVRKEEVGEVRNVIVFIADGVTSDLLSRAKFTENNSVEKRNDFVWDSFRHVGVLKSSCSIEPECDAFTLTTGLFGGVRTSKGLGGLDSRVETGNCQKAANKSFHIDSIFKQAKALNYRTGFVTTRFVSGPLMAGLYGHSSDTKWQCDGSMSQSSLKSECLDAALQLIKSKEGRNINVIMGGGRQTLVFQPANLNHSVIDESSCQRDLLQDWKSLKMKENASFNLIQTVKDLESLNGSSWDYVLGVFANGDLRENEGPNLSNLVMKSLDVLKRKNTGYVFVAETAVKSSEKEHFKKDLWTMDEAIREALQHPGFIANDTVVLTVFLDTNHTANGPNDILLYATGPNSHLLQGVHEDTYMAHVISYYLKMGIFRPTKNSKKF